MPQIKLANNANSFLKQISDAFVSAPELVYFHLNKSTVFCLNLFFSSSFKQNITNNLLTSTWFSNVVLHSTEGSGG